MSFWITSFSLCLLWIIDTTWALDMTQCRTALGMQTGAIPDSAITASSSYDHLSVGAINARIRTESNGGAWCPGKTISRDVMEWLQIDLGELKVITLVETQGRFGHGQGQEFTEKYLLEYKREETGSWYRFRDRREEEIIDGNTNTYIAELREVDPPIIARKIRFVPYSANPMTICMRVELYGCTWTDGTVSYSMHQGDRRGSEINLYDYTYDGKIEDNKLSGGLGQLVDGDEVESNFRLDPRDIGIKGYGWIGWRNDTFGGQPVELMFKFDAVRNFSYVRIYANNMFTKDVRVFRHAKIYFSIGGQHFLTEPVEFTFMRDPLIDYARQVTIPLHNAIGRYAKIHLYFDDRWMMISEVHFVSEYATGNFTEEVLTVPPMPRDSAGTRSPHIVEVIEGVFPETPSVLKPGNAEDSSTTTVSVIDTSKLNKNLDEKYIAIIIGTLVALICLLFLIIGLIIFRHRRRKYNNNLRAMKSIQPRHATLDLNDLRGQMLNGKLSNGNMYNCVSTSDMESDREAAACCTKLDARGDYYREPADSIQNRQLPDLPRTPESTDTNTSREYAVPDFTKSSLIVNLPKQHPSSLQPTAPPYSKKNPYRQVIGPVPTVSGTVPTAYACADVPELPNIQGVSGNTVYAVPGNLDMLWKDDLSVMEFPRNNINFVEKLGEGQFGEVHLCEAVRVTDFLGDDFLVNRTGGTASMLVAVKMLRRNADDQARADFHKEVKIMSRLKDPNIVRVLGVCTRDEPTCVIVEYMKFGDLNQFLHQHVLAENTLVKGKNVQTLSYGCLIYMASQVTSGMKYLESLNMVHRDLASRNCLVGHQYTIKISDFGMSRSLYSTDYYRIEGKAVLPIRWMAWESILLGKFSTKSDVWSFGVTLWEILTFAKDQPFGDLTDEQVIENCGHYYRNDSLETYLPRPMSCPREIYDLMRECWNRDENQRPAFREVHMFMQRKNMGYNPRDETFDLVTPTAPNAIFL